jgi:hypothetical protein
VNTPVTEPTHDAVPDGPPRAVVEYWHTAALEYSNRGRDAAWTIAAHICATILSAMDADTAGAGVLAEIGAERARQDQKFGEQNHRNGTGMPVYRYAANRYRAATNRAAAAGDVSWRDILLEELFEALAESDPAKLRAELLQIAAVAAAWIEAIDRRDVKWQLIGVGSLVGGDEVAATLAMSLPTFLVTDVQITARPAAPCPFDPECTLPAGHDGLTHPGAAA